MIMLVKLSSIIFPTPYTQDQCEHIPPLKQKKKVSEKMLAEIITVSIILDGPFRNDSLHLAVQWKRKRCWINPARFLFLSGAIRQADKDCLFCHRC